MKLKIGKDLVNNEHVLVIPNQITFVFDFEFTKLKIITNVGTKIFDIDAKKIYITYQSPRINFNEFDIYGGGGYYYRNLNYIHLNHHHVKNIIMFLIDNVPFKFEDYTYETPDLVKEVKCYTNRFVVTTIDELGLTVSTNGAKPISVWQYYFHLRDLKEKQKEGL